jgi:hypothetical protein
MKFKVGYSKLQLESAVDFISGNNIWFKNKKDVIRKAILNCMKDLAADPSLVFEGTMGFTIIADTSYEGIDNDESSIHFDISVNPSLGKDLDEDDYIESYINE